MDGISIRTCLSRVRNMALFGRPMAWKKFAPIIWKPRKGRNINQVCRAWTLKATSSLSLLNIDTSRTGMVLIKIKPKVVIQVATIIDSLVDPIVVPGTVIKANYRLETLV